MATLLPRLDEKNAPPQEIMERVTEGLAFETLGHVARAYGVTQETMADWLGVSARTRERRRRAGRFDRLESERLYRYIRLYRRAVEVFDDEPESAQQFLTESQTGLNGLIPAEVARSEYGASGVMDLLGRIDYGVHT